uniref:Uncharacterized protein n=1 Tax=Corethron hystrix TaxID=216773 RepID=A0A7S1FLM7_9STRA|mmetsp:Transcript_1430/g.2973  ORF Transcript_1430/g.2973 Transcript_1430/m.2973 type:complete len:293 (+) Transcript_1430:92-970(+)
MHPRGQLQIILWMMSSHKDVFSHVQFLAATFFLPLLPANLVLFGMLRVAWPVAGISLQGFPYPPSVPSTSFLLKRGHVRTRASLMIHSSAAHMEIELDRRTCFFGAMATILALPTAECASVTDIANSNGSSIADIPFRSGGYGLEDYTNAFVASRDTNISPKEAYDSIKSSILFSPLSSARTTGRIPRALDLGAGAGVSTQFLYEMGYSIIDAVDWSGKAWERFVTEDPSSSCPPSVKFYEMDDERYRAEWRSEQAEKFDVIVYNFAVNDKKALEFAQELLAKDGRVRLSKA